MRTIIPTTELWHCTTLPWAGQSTRVGCCRFVACTASTVNFSSTGMKVTRMWLSSASTTIVASTTPIRLRIFTQRVHIIPKIWGKCGLARTAGDDTWPTLFLRRNVSNQPTQLATYADSSSSLYRARYVNVHARFKQKYLFSVSHRIFLLFF